MKNSNTNYLNFTNKSSSLSNDTDHHISPRKVNPFEKFSTPIHSSHNPPPSSSGEHSSSNVKHSSPKEHSSTIIPSHYPPSSSSKEHSSNNITFLS
mmetsp:Transcript_18049/g.17372  ORF Transcript_18049/g.17372 Transcript_18049/m.17372 type:complete len:96 (+) Transcript_18049:1281-1568(+)